MVKPTCSVLFAQERELTHVGFISVTVKQT